jgi:hypothetical protein
MRYSPPCGDYVSSVFSTPSLVGLWRLGELSGTTAFDSKGSNNLTHSGGVTVGAGGALTGDNDKAASYDGVDDFSSRADTAAFEPGLGSFTWEMWFQTGVTTRVGLYRHSDGSNVNGVLLDVNGSAVGQVRVQVQSLAAATTGGTYNDGGWHHVAGVLDRSNNQLRLYVDGALKATTDVSSYSAVNLDSTGTVQVGSVSSPVFMSGKLDEVALYNTALSASKIKDHYDAR